MTFQQAIDYLYSRLPVFQNQGARAYKPGLSTTRDFCTHLGNPQSKFKSLHIGGTNGKGSTSHMLASVLQKSGYTVGLYTSPHLKNFTERIRVNGLSVEEEFVTEFVQKHQGYIETIQPSFFEVTVALAFDYFAYRQVDFAVIEVGMGGRLDSTNVIFPVLSIITNISFDHTQYLGNTLPRIAREKAGIIKEEVPIVISEQADLNVLELFKEVAQNLHAELYFAFEIIETIDSGTQYGLLNIEAKWIQNNQIEIYKLDLTGSYQLLNYKGVLVALDLLQKQGYAISNESISNGLSTVSNTTGLKGRWQTLQTDPLVICDTAHNVAGLSFTIKQFLSIPHSVPRFVLGFVADKDLDSILPLFPKTGIYYFCQPNNQRALSVHLLRDKALEEELIGECFDTVNDALKMALKEAINTDIIYVGGSTFVVADLDQL